ncbi:MAG: bifunctional adenosylcobinamide kinase/adenosylcobinamide-phosphate guanylyltransferase [Actinomycetota bacterium]
MLTLLTGPVASGKSTLAVRMASGWEGPVVVFATAEGRDDEMAERIARHRAERPSSWDVVEEPIDLLDAVRRVAPGACAVVDCVTLWVANLLGAGVEDQDVLKRAHGVAAFAAGRSALTIVVTNEVGWGIVPANDLARAYRGILGAVNRTFVEVADRSLLVVAGRAVSLEVPAP